MAYIDSSNAKSFYNIRTYLRINRQANKCRLPHNLPPLAEAIYDKLRGKSYNYKLHCSAPRNPKDAKAFCQPDMNIYTLHGAEFSIMATSHLETLTVRRDMLFIRG